MDVKNFLSIETLWTSLCGVVWIITWKWMNYNYVNRVTHLLGLQVDEKSALRNRIKVEQKTKHKWPKNKNTRIYEIKIKTLSYLLRKYLYRCHFHGADMRFILKRAAPRMRSSVSGVSNRSSVRGKARLWWGGESKVKLLWSRIELVNATESVHYLFIGKTQILKLASILL